jgi:hypothetical protein
MQSKAKSVSQYLASLPPAARRELARVRALVKKNLPKGYAETMQFGMISYVVPLKLYSSGYLGKINMPLPYVCLAAQKNYLALYLMNVYGSPKLEREFRAAFRRSKKKLDMGKSCVRFKTTDDLALDAVADAVASTKVKAFIARYERARR